MEPKMWGGPLTQWQVWEQVCRGHGVPFEVTEHDPGQFHIRFILQPQLQLQLVVLIILLAQASSQPPAQSHRPPLQSGLLRPDGKGFKGHRLGPVIYPCKALDFPDPRTDL